MTARAVYKLGINVTTADCAPHVKQIIVTGIFITINCRLWQYGTYTSGSIWYSNKNKLKWCRVTG